MDDDFSTPQAFAALFDLNREVNTMLASAEPNPDAIADAERLFSVLDGEVLGIVPEKFEANQSGKRIDDVMQLLIELRNRHRQQKDFASADLIRDRLQEIGITLKDSHKGTTWKD